MGYYSDYEHDEWSGTNGYGEEIRNPDAYYQAVNENRYGYNSNYSEHQRDNFYGNNQYLDDDNVFC